MAALNEVYLHVQNREPARSLRGVPRICHLTATRHVASPQSFSPDNSLSDERGTHRALRHSPLLSGPCPPEPFPGSGRSGVSKVRTWTIRRILQMGGKEGHRWRMKGKVTFVRKWDQPAVTAISTL